MSFFLATLIDTTVLFSSLESAQEYNNMKIRETERLVDYYYYLGRYEMAEDFQKVIKYHLDNTKEESYEDIK